MRTQLAVAVAAALVLSVPSARAASKDDTLTLVLDRSGQAVVTLPAFSVEPAEADMSVPRTGIAGFVLERLGEPVGSDLYVTGNATRLSAGVESAHVVSFHRDRFPAGRYLLSTTVTGDRSVVRFAAPGLRRDTVVRPTSSPLRTGLGGSTRLDNGSPVGDFSGAERIARSGLTRVWAVTSVAVLHRMVLAGELGACVSGAESSCSDGASGFFGESISAFGTSGIQATAVYGPDARLAGQLVARQYFTGAAADVQAYGWGVAINAPLPR